MSEWWGPIAALLSAVAACLAVVATWRAPIVAARLAERLRRDAAREEAKQTQKEHLFSTLMQERGAIYSDVGVRTLNLIDVVFNDSREVREAWAELFHSFDPQSKVPQHAQEERLRRLLATIAKDIGLGDDFRADDFSRIYFPAVLAQERFIRDMERQQALARLQGQAVPTANTATPQSSIWPPTPTPPTPQ